MHQSGELSPAVGRWLFRWYNSGMKTTIDAAGRLVVPKQLRDELGIGPGQPVEVAAVEGHLEVTIPPTPMHLEERDGLLVAVPDNDVTPPPLSADTVRQTLEHVRR